MKIVHKPFLITEVKYQKRLLKTVISYIRNLYVTSPNSHF
jgi:hypothetical protein